MRSVLLTGTAMAVVGLVTGNATADDGLRLGLGGKIDAFAAAVDQDDDRGEAGDGRRNHEIRQEAEVGFAGELDLQNGLMIGVSMQAVDEQNDFRLDESYIYVEGGFGRIEVGSEDPAPNAMFYGAPVAIPGVGLSTPDQVFAALTNSVGSPETVVSISGNAEKLTYFTPRISGIQLGLSYTPDNCEEVVSGRSGSACGRSFGGFQREGIIGQQYDIVEAAANYVATHGAVDIAAYIGVAAGNLQAGAADAQDREQWGVGAELGIAGFSIGGEYRWDNRGAIGDRRDWAFGLSYGEGPWTVGLQYVNARADDVSGPSDDKTEGFQVGAGLELGPGILLSGGVTVWDVDDNLRDPAAENEAITFVIGTLVSF